METLPTPPGIRTAGIDPAPAAQAFKSQLPLYLAIAGAVVTVVTAIWIYRKPIWAFMKRVAAQCAVGARCLRIKVAAVTRRLWQHLRSRLVTTTHVRPEIQQEIELEPL